MKRRRIVWIAATLVAAAAIAWAVFPCGLRAVYYTAENPKLTAPLRIVQLSDLHNAVFGANNSRLIALVAAQEPALILCTGDFVTQTEESTAEAEALLASLAEIAPVYVSLGNHELGHDAAFGTDLAARYTRAGAQVLDYAYADAVIAGQNVRIGGVSGYALPQCYLASGEANEQECAYLAEFQNTDACTLLMAHMPAGWLYSRGLEQWQVDAVFSGHAHGGQVILPLLGGLYAPDMGWFPGRLAGLFRTADGSRLLALTTGLGSSVPVPRIHNPPEILVLDLVPLP